MNESSSPLSNLSEVRGILSRIPFLGGIEGDAFESMYGYFEHTAIKAVDLRKREFSVGDHFCEVAMLSMINDNASFFAVEDCQLIAFSRKSLARLSREESLIFRQLMLNLARDLARKVQYSDELMLRGSDV